MIMIYLLDQPTESIAKRLEDGGDVLGSHAGFVGVGKGIPSFAALGNAEAVRLLA